MPSSIQPRRRLQRRSSATGPSRAKQDSLKYKTVSEASSSSSLYNVGEPPPAKPSARRFASSPSMRHRTSRVALSELFVNTSRPADEEEVWSDDHHDSEWEPYSSSTPTSTSLPVLPPGDHSQPRLTYSSLPPTPLSPSPPPPLSAPIDGTFPSDARVVDLASPIEPNGHADLQSRRDDERLHSELRAEPFSLWDYLREELISNDFDEHQEMKWERVVNFFSIPVAMEKIISFGFLLCLDSFLYTFTILPIRFVLAVSSLLRSFLPSHFTTTPRTLPSSQKADILRTLLLAVSLAILVPLTDASKIYHSIRGQDTIKLYVIFNVLEIADRLLASIGQDIIDCLFSRPTLAPTSRRSKTFRPLSFFALAVFYVVLHTLTMTYQTISLNVAVNSYDYSLLTLLVSNQFVEIKGSVFKKFEKDNLFQITCADIVERFTLSLMLIIVAFRNLIEVSGSAVDWSGEESIPIPKSFRLPKRVARWLPWGSVFGTISYPVLTVLVSEMLVDWLKHAFITKFNHIRPSVYERYTDVLCGDLKGGWVKGRKHSYVDQSPLVARRLGFAALPLANLAIIIGSQCFFLLQAQLRSPSSTPDVFPGVPREVPTTWLEWLKNFEMQEAVTMLKWAVLVLSFWVCTVVIKIIIGINLLNYASRRQAGVSRREAQDVINDWGRDPIGEGEEEKKYNRELKKFLDNKHDDASPTAEIGERKPERDDGDGGEKKKRLKLEEITRFTMVKRIW